MGNFGTLLGATTYSLKKQGELNVSDIKRGNYNQVQDIKNQQRSAMFATINEVLGIANVVEGNLSQSKELGIFAQSEGFTPKGSLFNRVFGNVKYEKNGKEYSSQDILGLQALREYERQRALMSEDY